MSTPWRISVYDAVPSETGLTLSGSAFRFVYAVRGSVEVETEAGPLTAAPETGVLTRGPVTLRGSGEAWIYEVDPTGAMSAEVDGLSLVLSHGLVPPEGGLIMRADHVVLPPGTNTPRHGHRGPGIRRLLYGQILAEIGDDFDRIAPGQAWFETGRDPVIGHSLKTGESAFVRVMVLPVDLAGGTSSFVPWTSADAAASRAVTYRLFGEMTVDPAR